MPKREEEILLRLENVSKLYRLGLITAETFKEDVYRLWQRIRGKPDPLLNVSDENKREVVENKKYIWAIQDISFDLYRGDTLGLIGKNGAGKSTLLKVLSRITRPTKGHVYMNGTVSSLLEVGTGFHGELTGHENIYLSGSMLGMTRTQIANYYDKIVAFSGMERFLDTPIKRYSSGMSLRLAFSVAIHLQADILIMDEVLAVGDHEFRRRAVDKMAEIADTESRTIIYVSHQLNTVKSVCDRGILLEKGRIKMQGDMDMVLRAYTESHDVEEQAIYTFDAPINVAESKGYVRRIVILDEKERLCAEARVGEDMTIQVDFCIQRPLPDVSISLQIDTWAGIMVNVAQSKPTSLSTGEYTAHFSMKDFHLGAGSYKLSVQMISSMQMFEHLYHRASFQISNIAKDSHTNLVAESLVVTPMHVKVFENAYAPIKTS